MFKLGSFVVDFIIGMVVAAYILSHTSVGQKLYSRIATLPTITAEDVSGFMDNAVNAGGKVINIGGKLVEIIDQK